MLANAPISAILVAADIERAKTFYRDTLGLRPVDMPGMPEDSALFGCGGDTMLFVYEREGGSKAEHTVAGWRVDDLDAAIDELGKRGIEFEQYEMGGLKTDERGIAEVSGSRSAWFKDTEGNVLAISEY